MGFSGLSKAFPVGKANSKQKPRNLILGVFRARFEFCWIGSTRYPEPSSLHWWWSESCLVGQGREAVTFQDDPFSFSSTSYWLWLESAFYHSCHHSHVILVRLSGYNYYLIFRLFYWADFVIDICKALKVLQTFYLKNYLSCVGLRQFSVYRKCYVFRKRQNDGADWFSVYCTTVLKSTKLFIHQAAFFSLSLELELCS